MEELRGWTAIDTLYEVKGFQVAASYFGPLYLSLGAALFGFGLLRTLYKTGETHRFRDLVVFLAASVILFWLIQPTTVSVAAPAGYAYDASVEEMVESGRTGAGARVVIGNVPRVMALSHAMIDEVTRFMVRAVDRTFEDKPFAQDRAAVLLRLSRVKGDDALRERYHEFVVACYVPVLAARERQGLAAPDPYYDPFKIPSAEYAPFAIPDRTGEDGETIPWTPCGDLSSPLYQELARNVQERHEETLQVVHDVLQKKGGFGVRAGQVQHAVVVDVVLRYVLHNETRGLLSTNEVAALRKALPEYSMFDPAMQSSGNSQDATDYVRTTLSFLVKLKQSVNQWINHHAEGPATYYKAVCYGPYVYGLAGMLILAVFPLAGFISLLPGHWTVLFTWMKMLLSVKLWMVFWSILSRFNEYRYRLEDIGSGPENGIGDQSYLFPAIAAMYLMTPGLSLLAVQLLSAAGKAASGAFSHFAPSSGAHGPDVWGNLSRAAEGGARAVGYVAGGPAGGAVAGVVTAPLEVADAAQPSDGFQADAGSGGDAFASFPGGGGSAPQGNASPGGASGEVPVV